MQQTQGCKNPNEKREKRGVPQWGRRGRRRRGIREEQEGKGRPRRGSEALDSGGTRWQGGGQGRNPPKRGGG